jgi:hypothetical protein
LAREIHLNHQFLVEVGLGHLEGHQQEAVLRKLYEVLQLRVGYALTGSLTKSEMAIFEQLMEEGDHVAAQDYLRRVVPGYGVAVRSELDFIADSLLRSVHQGRVVIAEVGEEKNG